jgi:hypothetical protein
MIMLANAGERGKINQNEYSQETGKCERKRRD